MNTKRGKTILILLALLAIIAIAMCGCSGEAECTSPSRQHDWGKWEQSGQTNGFGAPIITRKCDRCGFEQRTCQQTL